VGDSDEKGEKIVGGGKGDKSTVIILLPGPPTKWTWRGKQLDLPQWYQ